MTKICFWKIFGLHPQFLPYESPNPWNILSNMSKGSIFYNIWSLVPSSWNSFRAIKVKWVSCYSQEAPSHHNWVYDNEGHFWNPPKEGGWLSRELIMNTGLEVPVSVPGSPGRGEWLEVESNTNGQCANQSCWHNKTIRKHPKDEVQRTSRLWKRGASACHQARLQGPQEQKLLCWGHCPM